MADLSTSYLGLSLRNPLIVSSCGLTGSVDKIAEIEQGGAGAVVLKSLFEEQIQIEAGRLSTPGDYPEALDYIRNYTRSHSVDEYLRLIGEARKKVSIPVIASINCVSSGDWTDFARKIEAAGADALELNVFTMPTDPSAGPVQMEKLYLELAERIRRQLAIPVSFKLGYYFTNLVRLVDQLCHRRVNGVVLFNRFYSPDIDIEKLGFTSAEVYSSPADIRYSLRWVGLVSSKVPGIDIAASTGVHSGEALIKQVLAGAHAVQVCSVLYKKGVEYIGTILEDAARWMKNHGFDTLPAFRGKMNYGNIADPGIWERSQFMKYFSSHQ